MYLLVSLEPDAAPPLLREVSDLRSLKVLVHGDGADLGDALSSVGYVADDGDAFLDIAALLALAGDSADPEWRQGFDAMVEYARHKGWVDEAGRALQAHCERVPERS